jgi:hypothetical protein
MITGLTGKCSACRPCKQEDRKLNEGHWAHRFRGAFRQEAQAIGEGIEIR